MSSLLLEAATGTGLETTTWEFIRASGLVAFLLLSASTFLGVATTVRALDPLTKRVYVYEGHQTLSLLALAVICLHVILLLAHRFVEFTLLEVFVPFTSDWRPLPVALGTTAAYIVAILTLSSYAKTLIGQAAWRVLHYLSFAAWILAMGHGITAGSDAGSAGVQWFYLAAGGSVGLLLVFRLLVPSNRPKARVTGPRSPSLSPAGGEEFAQRERAAR